MYQYHCLNAISNVGLEVFDENYTKVDNINDADAVLVRSAAMHDMEFGENVKVIARAGAGVNNIPLTKCADHGTLYECVGFYWLGIFSTKGICFCP